MYNINAKFFLKGMLVYETCHLCFIMVEAPHLSNFVKCTILLPHDLYFG